MKYYLTTPIYYVNAAPHIGHTYTTMVADTIKRHKTMCGYDVVLTTGTDEHGQKIERAAKAAGKSPQEFTDAISAEFRSTWEKLGLGIDRFKRTTDASHARMVQELFDRCRANGYIYKSSYTGQYCVSCELYVNDAKPGDPCPDCGRPTETVTEENFYFKLSAFQEKLLKFHTEERPDFAQPETRRNEVLAFIKQGLNDLSITRTTIKWGIPVADEEPHVFYVWFDALMTYMSAVEGEGLWPAQLHLIGKEILRFHAIFWPAFLWAADWPLPERLYAHGWLLFDNDKMSKSKGNLLRPLPIHQVVGADALRYFLLREVVFGQDGNFSLDALVTRYNADLANGLGNLAARTLSMIAQYRGGVIPERYENHTIATQAMAHLPLIRDSYDAFNFSRALETLWVVLSSADKSIVDVAPWKRVKSSDEADRWQVDSLLYSLAELLRISCILLAPVLPEASRKIWTQLGMTSDLAKQRIDALKWADLEPGQKIGETTPVFPRLEAKPAIEKILALEEKEIERQNALLGKKPAAAAAQGRPEASPTITIDDFAKVDLRVGVVQSAEKVKGADKLLHLHVDIGEEQPRSIVAGIATAYEPEKLVGRKVVIVANLQPRKLRGLESQGMVVAGSLDGGAPVLAGFLEDIPVGARLR